MTLAQIIESYVAHQRSLGMRFDSSAKLLLSFHRAIGPVEVDQIDQETVSAFLNRSHITSTWHTRYYALNGLFRFAIQRRLLDASPMPYLIPKRRRSCAACSTQRRRWRCTIPRTGSAQASNPTRSGP